jgi:hypothetical protein
VLVVAVLVGVMAGLLRPLRARFGAPRAVAVVLAAAGTDVVSVATTGVAHAALLATSVMLGTLWLALHRRHLASVLLGIGVDLNVAVVVNGWMPVDPGALACVSRGDVDVTRDYLNKHLPILDAARLPTVPTASWCPGNAETIPRSRVLYRIGYPAPPNVADRGSVHELPEPRSAHTGGVTSSRHGDERAECRLRACRPLAHMLVSAMPNG